MTSHPEYIAFLLEQLAGSVPATARKMFGGYGLFADGVMFGLVADDVLFFKVDGENREMFEEAGSGPFTYEGKSKPVAMSYYECPAEAFDDPAEMARWARSALEAALRQRKPAKKPRRKAGRT